MVIPLIAAVLMSSASTYLFLRIQEIRERRRYRQNHYNHGSKCDDGGSGGEKCAMMSSRGIQARNTPTIPYIGSHLKCLADPCHPETNPTGYISLCIAENKLIVPELSRRLLQSTHPTDKTAPPTSSHESSSQIMFSDLDHFTYNDNRGMAHTRSKVARFLTKYFLRGPSTTTASPVIGGDAHNAPDNEMTNTPHADNLLNGDLADVNTYDADAHTDAHTDTDENVVNPDHLLLTTGGANILNLLCFALAEENDVVLIPEPYYAAFETDMKAFAGMVVCGVQTSNPSKGPTVEELEVAFKNVEQQGLRVRILLLTNPTNPLGTIYRSNVLLDSIAWARGMKIHTVVDEIYALSVHDVSTLSFF